MRLRIGAWTAMVGGAALIAIALMVVSTAEGPPVSQSGAAPPSVPKGIYWDVQMMKIGLVYAVVSQCVWALGSLGQDRWRWLAVLVIALVGAICLTRLAVPGWPSQLASDATSPPDSARLLSFLSWLLPLVSRVAFLLGLAIAQSVLFYLLAIVPRHAATVSLDGAPSQHSRQFSLVDLLCLTLAVAFVLAIAKRTETPIEPQWYWIGWVVIWIGVPMITAAGAYAGSTIHWSGAIFAGGLTLALAGVGALALGYMERMTHDAYSVNVADQHLSKYGTCLLTIAVFSLLFTFAGRLDAASYRRRCSQQAAELS